MKKIMVFMVVVSLLIPTLSFAKKVKYEVVDVTNGGTIKGKIKTTKKVKDPLIPIKISPDEKPEDAEKIRNTCGESQQTLMYLISPDMGVKNALVIVEGVKKGKAAPKKDLTLDNNKCRFEPIVGISYLKSQYVIKNSDPLLHNTSLGKIIREGVRRTVYNLALPFKDQVIKKPNRVAGLINVKCDAHPWMRAYVYSSRHPYVAITDANGNFEIKDLLPGKYKVRFWHEGFEEVVKEIDVKAGKASALNVTFKNTRKPVFMGGL
ncbi:MAG: carboxypeptidase regulatory-like domain-containing protein [Thermodesulfovibrionia bacterium]|nr:carboxypeptidase regulatory-like domain-containing protein [Thermodesulfovibrionia bacterium]